MRQSQPAGTLSQSRFLFGASLTRHLCRFCVTMFLFFIHYLAPTHGRLNKFLFANNKISICIPSATAEWYNCKLLSFSALNTIGNAVRMPRPAYLVRLCTVYIIILGLNKFYTAAVIVKCACVEQDVNPACEVERP